MAHALSSDAAPAILRNAELDRAAVWQARVDLAACFRMAARLGLHEGVCNHFSAMVPGRDDRPTGCLLSPRCPYADDHCRTVPPALQPYVGPNASGSPQVRCFKPLPHACHLSLPFKNASHGDREDSPPVQRAGGAVLARNTPSVGIVQAS
ncbi:MAG: hypothetical protein J0H99_18480, partial [Rhodospirillales bacterium]|nr:hypothetical protein [Rhodospirillales bacterium]